MATWTYRSDARGKDGDSSSPTFTAVATAGEIDAARGLLYKENSAAESSYVMPGRSAHRRTPIVVFEIQGSSVSTTDEVVIKNLPPLVTLYGGQFTIVTGGSATTLDPSLGRIGSFTADTIDQITNNVTPGDWVDLMAESQIRRMWLPDGKLVVRPKPDATATTIKFILMLGIGV